MKWNPTPKNLSSKSLSRGSVGSMRNSPTYTTEWDIDRAVDSAWGRVTWVYRCVDAIASNAARMEIVVRADNPWDGTPVENHPLYEVLNSRANVGESSIAFRYRLSAQLLLSRRGVFVEVTRNNAGDPIALTLLPPDAVEPIKDAKKYVSGYILRHEALVNGQVRSMERRLKNEDVVWIKRPHPFDPYMSTTPLDAAGVAIETDWLAKLYNRNFMLNDGRPGGMVVIKGDMTDDDKEELRSRFSGSITRAGRVAVVASDDGADFVDTAITPRDAQYQETRLATKEEILLAFGVPETVLSNAKGSSFDNAETERLVFWQETMLPHMDLIVRPLDVLDGSDNRFVSYDLSRIDVLQRVDTKRKEYLLREFDAGGTTVNEYRAATGRDPIPGDLGDTIWMPRVKVPVGTSNGNGLPDFDYIETPSPPGRPASGSVQEEPEDEPRERDDERLAPLDNTDNSAPAAQLSAEEILEIKEKVSADYLRWSELARLRIKDLIDRQAIVLNQKVGGPKFKRRIYRDGQDFKAEISSIYDSEVWDRQAREDLGAVVSGAFKDGYLSLKAELGLKDEIPDFNRTFAFGAVSEIVRKAIDDSVVNCDPSKILYIQDCIEDALGDLSESKQVTELCDRLAVHFYNMGRNAAIQKAGAKKQLVALDGASNLEMKLDGEVVGALELFKYGRTSLLHPGTGAYTNSVIIPAK